MPGKVRASVIALPVIGALFGSQAFQLGQVVARGFNLLGDGARNRGSEVQAGLLAIGIGLLVIVAATSALSKQDGEAEDHLIATIVTTVLAGAFSILRETQDPTLTGSAWTYGIFVAAVALLFVVPTFALPGSSMRPAAILYVRAAAAALTGLLCGAAIQLAVVALPRTWFPTGTILDGQQAAFFQIAPTGIGLLLPAWSMVTFDPLLRRHIWKSAPRRRSALWITCYAASAILLSWLYGLAVGHSAAVVLLLVLPSLIAVGILLVFKKTRPDGESPIDGSTPSNWTRRLVARANRSVLAVWPALVLAGVFSALASSLSLQLLSNVSAAPLPAITTMVFVVSHVLAAASAVFAFGFGNDTAATSENPTVSASHGARSSQPQ